MQRTVTIAFNSGSIAFTVDYVDPDTERNLGYLVDDALSCGGKITFDQVIPRLNSYCRGLEHSDTGTTVTANGSSMIDGVESIVRVTAQLGYAGVDFDKVNAFLKGTIVRDTLGYLVEMATTPEPHDCQSHLADLVEKLKGFAVNEGFVPTEGGTFDFGAANPFARP